MIDYYILKLHTHFSFSKHWITHPHGWHAEPYTVSTNFKKIVVIQSLCSEYSRIKIEVNNYKTCIKLSSIWQCSHIFLQKYRSKIDYMRLWKMFQTEYMEEEDKILSWKLSEEKILKCKLDPPKGVIISII